MCVQADPDPAHHLSVELDRESLVFGSNLATDERTRILLGVRMRNRRDPARDVRVVAAGDHRIDVVLRPRTKHEIAVAKLHASSLETTDGLCGRDSGRL